MEEKKTVSVSRRVKLPEIVPAVNTISISQMPVMITKLPKLDYPGLALQRHLEATQQVTRQLAKAMEPFAELSKQLQKALGPHAEMILAAQKVLADTMKIHLTWAEELQKSVAPILSFARSIDPIVPKSILLGLTEAARRTERLHELHAKDKTFLPPFLNEFGIREIFELFADESKTSIEVYHDYFLRAENVEALTTAWESNELFRPRLRILKAALRAHLEKNFELSVPVLMREFEGLMLDLLSINQKQIRGHVEKVFPRKERKDSYLSHLSVHYVFPEIICNEVFNSNEKEGYAPSGLYPNRYRIQHGVDITYYENEHYSTRLIMLMDALRSEELSEALERYNRSLAEQKNKVVLQIEGGEFA